MECVRGVPTLNVAKVATLRMATRPRGLAVDMIIYMINGLVSRHIMCHCLFQDAFDRRPKEASQNLLPL
jgi:hypothetical protein